MTQHGRFSQSHRLQSSSAGSDDASCALRRTATLLGGMEEMLVFADAAGDHADEDGWWCARKGLLSDKLEGATVYNE